MGVPTHLLAEPKWWITKLREATGMDVALNIQAASQGCRLAFFVHHFHLEISSPLFPFLCNMLVYATCSKLNCLGWTTGLCGFLLLIYVSVVQFMLPSLLKCFCNISLFITKEWISWNKPLDATHTMCQKREEPTLSHTSSSTSLPGLCAPSQRPRHYIFNK